MTRTRLRQCVAAAAVGRVDLPLGWTARNIRLAYCTPHEKGPGETVPVATSCLRNQDAIFTGQPGLGIGEVWLEGPGFSDGFIALCGFWLTALFVSMGAPFWFDLLGRVVKLRAAGTRASEDTSPQATATSPPATPAKTGGSSSDNLALNDFERDLGKDDIVFLQQSVGAPETGVLDGATRDAIVAKKKALAQAGKYATGDVSAELSVASYFALTDRLPKSRATTATGFQSTSVDQPDAQAAPLALRLEDHMLADIKGSVTHPLLRFTADLRALTVLYRYKRDKAANVPLMDREVVKAARSKGVLDTLPADFAKGLPDKDTLYPRETPAWLDWALGELGQLEKNLTTREGSNPRVIEYLDAAGMPRTAGDATAWCGAFVNWVFKKYNRLPPKDGRLVANTPAGPAAAHAWAGWGTEVWTLAADTADDRPGPMQPGDWTTCGVQPGDILLTRSRDRATWRAKAQQDQAGNPRGIAHVAFVLAIDAAAPGVLLALGGNQDSGTTVCVSRFPNNDDEVVCVRRPRLLDPLAG